MRRASTVCILLIGLGAPVSAFAQSGAWSRVSLFGITQNTKYEDGTARRFNEVILNIRMRSATVEEGDGFEYAFDVRGSGSPGATAGSRRTNIYDAWLSGRTAGGALRVRAGQMWLDELGGIGSVGGLSAEYLARSASAAGRFRAGIFGGLDPKNFEPGYVAGVKKGGGWLALDGKGNRRHVVGYVLIRDARLTERSVITTTNFVPVGKRFFLYQAGEYDLRGPGGLGKGGLNYFFANARFTPVPAVEIMTTFHRGRSIDTRTITQDLLDGRPVDQKALDGFRFESAGGRLTVEVVRNLRLYAGYSSDRNNGSDTAAGRVTAGLWASNIAGSGIDFTLSDNRINQTTGKYDAWYASLGRSLGRSFYGSLDYSTSLSVVRFQDSGGVIVETRPRTKRYGANAVWNVSRWLSLLITAEELRDGQSVDDRVMLGTTFRF